MYTIHVYLYDYAYFYMYITVKADYELSDEILIALIIIRFSGKRCRHSQCVHILSSQIV